jgi:hypothetical protein
MLFSNNNSQVDADMPAADNGDIFNMQLLSNYVAHNHVADQTANDVDHKI